MPLTIMYPLSQHTPKIFALPSELIQEVLVIVAARRFYSAIAAFGSTCRHFHLLVYRSADRHLWREIFLTTFDDPRPVLRRLGNTTTTGPGEGDEDIAFDWTGEFQRRVNAARLFRNLEKTTPKLLDIFSHSSKNSVSDQSLTLATALETVISVLETAAPFPLHHTEAMAPAPTFPPLVTLHLSSAYPAEFISRNSRWADEILKRGYPPCLVKNHLLAGHQPSKPLKVTEDNWFTYSEEGQLFHKLVFRKGFIPVPTGRGSEVLWKTVQSIEDQSVAVRKVARSKVYNLRYLRPERSWGPFLPANGSLGDADGKSKPKPTFPDFVQELSRYMLSNIGEQLSDFEDEDEDFVPAEDEQDHNDHEDDDEDIILSFPFVHHRIDPKFVKPSPHEVKPDYTYLASARLLVEMNLREMMLIMNQPVHELVEREASPHAIINALASLDFGRMGGAPAFWETTWVEPRPESIEDLELECPPVKPMPQKPNRKGKGKGKATEIEWIQGWDWAGVTGRWMRVVCWLDYRDLLNHNLHGYTGDEMTETIHVFPTDLRIVGYSKPPEPDFSQLEHEDLNAPVWKLPVIHFEGVSHGHDDDLEINKLRKMRGTVRMLKDGAIRWSLMSIDVNGYAPEWSTEAIQIGSIGSVVGMLGMWTGADHGRTDPLGPIWIWKVA